MQELKTVLVRPVIAAVTAGILVAAAIMILTITRPTEYTARVGILASPYSGVTDAGPATPDFPGVAAQSMAAVVEVAHSPSVIAKASAETNGEMTPEDVFDAVSVELVPGSGLARLTVKAASPTLAGDVATTIGNDIVGQNLLGPAGTLRLLDSRPDVREVYPDLALGGGLALASGIAAGVAVLGLVTIIRPSRRRRIERALGAAGFSSPVAIVDGGDPTDVAREIEVLARASAQPVRVVALTKAAELDAEKLALELDSVGVRVANDHSDASAPIVAVATTSDRSADIRCTAAALPSRAKLLAVVMQ